MFRDFCLFAGGLMIAEAMCTGGFKKQADRERKRSRHERALESNSTKGRLGIQDS